MRIPPLRVFPYQVYALRRVKRAVKRTFINHTIRLTYNTVRLTYKKDEYKVEKPERITKKDDRLPN